MTWTAAFADGGTEYIAFGRDRNRMAVFRVDCALGGPIMERLAMTFPGCLRFLSPDRVSRPRRAGAADVGHRGVPGAHGSGKVFEPFVRLEASRSRDTGGSGLGLAIARGIVRGHGGDIVLENRAEGGLRATAALPEAVQA